MRIKSLLIAITLWLTSISASGDCLGQRRNPSTPEERARAVELAHKLEENPLGEEAKKARDWLDEWIREVPDIGVLTCSRLLEADGKAKDKYKKELTMQMAASVAAFIIEHPDQAENPDAKIKAGIEGVLKAYEVILKTNTQARSPFLDGLIEKKNVDASNEYIRDVMAKCSSVPLSDRNGLSNRFGEIVYAPIEVDRIAKLLTKPEPQYTSEAVNRVEKLLHLLRRKPSTVGHRKLMVEGNTVDSSSIEFAKASPAKVIP